MRVEDACGSGEIDAFREMVQGGSPRSSNRAPTSRGLSAGARLWSPYEIATIEQTRGADFVTRGGGAGGRKITVFIALFTVARGQGGECWAPRPSESTHNHHLKRSSRGEHQGGPAHCVRAHTHRSCPHYATEI